METCNLQFLSNELNTVLPVKETTAALKGGVISLFISTETVVWLEVDYEGNLDEVHTWGAVRGLALAGR